MKLFNARLDVQTVTSLSASTWRLEGVMIDNSGSFMADSILANQIVYCYGLNGLFEINVSRYKVTIVESTTGVNFSIVVAWDEPSTQYAEPQVSMDAIIGVQLPGGTTAMTTVGNGVGNEILSLARNIDLQVAKFSTSGGGYDMTPTTISSVGGVITLPKDSTHFFIVNGMEPVTRITGWTSGQVNIMWNYSREIYYQEGVLEPVSSMGRTINQGEITSFIFLGSCAKEFCPPGGNAPLDGGSV